MVPRIAISELNPRAASFATFKETAGTPNVVFLRSVPGASRVNKQERSHVTETHLHTAPTSGRQLVRQGLSDRLRMRVREISPEVA